MKTATYKTMDAVIEFKGEWEGGEGQGFIFEYPSGGFNYGGNITTQTICTHQEFNDLVSQLETNFGESLSYKEYVSIQAVGASMVGKPSQPVFTQAMADNGELPQVGARITLRYNFDSKRVTHSGTVLFASGRNCILETEHGEQCFKIGDYIYEAIDTRTDKEKAADEFIKDMTGSDFIKEQFKKTFLAGAEWAGE